MLGVGPSMVSVAAAMGYRDPFVLPASPQQRVQAGRCKSALAKGAPSDPVVVHRAIQVRVCMCVCIFIQEVCMLAFL